MSRKAANSLGFVMMLLSLFLGLLLFFIQKYVPAFVVRFSAFFMLFLMVFGVRKVKKDFRREMEEKQAVEKSKG